MFKFLHAADIHLDSPMRGLSNYPDAPVEAMRNATREALKNLVGLAISEECAFVVIAGDLFDGTSRDVDTAHIFSREMGRLNEVTIGVYIVYGNHDAGTDLRKMPWPSNVRTLDSKKAETILIEQIGVAIHGRSFDKKEVTENIAATYPEPVSGMFNIGILHTALEGGYVNHSNYAPCSMDDLTNAGYNYWALGHVHDFSVEHEDPYVVYSGNLQGRSVRETGRKGAVLVTVDDGNISIDHRTLDATRWEQLTVDLSDMKTEGQLFEALQDELNDILGRVDGLPTAVRFTLSGKTELYSKLVSQKYEIDEEIRILATGVSDDLWVEKIKFEIEPVVSLEALQEREDAIGDLSRRLAHAQEDEELVALLKADVDELMRKLPASIRESSSDLISSVEREDLMAVIDEARSQLVAQLTEVE